MTISLAKSRTLAQLMSERYTIQLAINKLQPGDRSWSTLTDARTLIGDEISKILKNA